VYSQSGVIPLGLVKPSDPKIDLNYVQGSATAGMRTTPGSGGAAGADATSAARAEAAAPPPAPEGGGAGMNVQGLPLIKPPYGRISAIDLNTGDFVWQVAHGETPDNIKNHAALKGLNIPRTGQAGNIGTLVTKTLVIAGEPRVTVTSTGARGAMLRAYNKATGAEVGAVYLPAPQSGSPMTYEIGGKQYLIVAVSGGNYSGELIAFRLPG
jgi:quinoprotein glucose dehydrogenase